MLAVLSLFIYLFPLWDTWGAWLARWPSVGQWAIVPARLPKDPRAGKELKNWNMTNNIKNIRFWRQRGNNVNKPYKYQYCCPAALIRPCVFEHACSFVLFLFVSALGSLGCSRCVRRGRGQGRWNRNAPIPKVAYAVPSPSTPRVLGWSLVRRQQNTIQYNGQWVI